eukprot:561927_1
MFNLKLYSRILWVIILVICILDFGYIELSAYDNISIISDYSEYLNSTMHHKQDAYSLLLHPSTNIYNVCNTKDKLNVLIGTHHKTGTHLFVDLIVDLAYWFQRKCNRTLPRKGRRILEWIEFHHDTFAETVTNEIRAISNTNKTTEATTKKHTFDNMTQVVEWKHKYRKRIFGPKMYCYHYMFHEKGSVLKLDGQTAHNYVVKQLLNNALNLSMGLLYEYQRFLCFDWKNMLSVHRLLTSKEVRSMRDTKLHVAEFSMDAFKIDYIGECKRLLTALQIFDAEDRAFLMRNFSAHDLTSSATNLSEPNYLKHITHGLYDKKQQLSALLGENETRCLKLRNMTFALDLDWTYADYC